MGRSPDRSVTNQFGQLWEVPNVFVAGGALFPSLSGHNPTQTMWALGFLTSDAILHGVVDLADASAFGRLPTH
jgi:gluconate 2-dehydrogenase alpha chain